MGNVALIFDLDGTLWDSTKVVAESWSLCGKKYFGESFYITEENVKAQMGLPMEEIAKAIAKLTADQEKGKAWAKEAFVYEVEYLADHPGELFPKEEEVLEELKRRGYDLFIMSNCQKGYIEDYLKALKHPEVFKDHICYGDTLLPKHGSIKLLLEKHKIEKAAYIGDTAGDEKETRLIGLPFFFASYGFGKAFSPDATLEEFEDILLATKTFFERV